MKRGTQEGTAVNQRARVMADIDELARVDYCAICGKCLATCPTYYLFRDELHGPRGRLQLVKAYVDGGIDKLGEKFFQALSYCLLCGSCQRVCPAQSSPYEAVLLFRNLPEFRRAFSFWERLALRHIVVHPRLLDLASWPLRIYQQLTPLRGVGAFLHQLRIVNELLPTAQGAPFFSRLPDRTPVAQHEQTVLFFVGCAMNILLPEFSLASLRLIEHAGYQVLTPRVACCGAPHLHEGELDCARQLARRNLSTFASLKPELIVSDCASCTATLCSYDQLLGDDDEYRELARQLQSRVMDLTQFVAQHREHYAFRQVAPAFRVVWDDPCQLVHLVGTPPAREVLCRIPGLQLAELEEAGECCGAAGAFVLKFPQIAEQILERKYERLREVAPDYVVTGNPGCYLQWRRLEGRAGLTTRVDYFSSFLSRFLITESMHD